MKASMIAAIAPLVLVGCATTGGVSTPTYELDEKGFALRPDGALFHPGTGLHCPSAIDDVPRVSWTEYREGVDAGCNYNGYGKILTLYAYESDLTLDQELEQAVLAAMQSPNNQTYTISEGQSETCQEIGNSYNIQDQILSGLGALMNDDSREDNTITINTDPGAGALPYRAVAMEADGVRSYAAVSQSDGWRMKVRYTVPATVNDAETLTVECQALHDITKDLSFSRGNADGAYEESSMMGLLGTG